jgi:hypothetical protein
MIIWQKRKTRIGKSTLDIDQTQMDNNVSYLIGVEIQNTTYFHIILHEFRPEKFAAFHSSTESKRCSRYIQQIL